MSHDSAPFKDPENTWPVGKRQAFFALFVVVGLGIFDFVDRQVMAVLLPYLKAEYTLTDTQLGLLVSIVNIAMAAFVIPSGYLIDRWSRTKTLGLMAVGWSLATGACAFVGTYMHLLVARLFIGLGEAGYNPAGQSLLTVLFPKKLRASVIAAMQFACGLGAPLGLLAGGFIAQHWGWRHAFGIVAIPGLFFAFAAFFIRDFKAVKAANAATENRDTPKESYLKVIGQLLSTRTLLIVFLAQSCQLIAGATLINWLPSYFNRVAHMTVAESGNFSAIYLIVGSAATLVGGPAFDFVRSRFKMTHVCVGQGTLNLIGFLCIFTAFQWVAPGTALQLFLLIASTFFVRSLPTLGFTITSDLSLPHQRGTAVSLLISMQNIFGMAIGPLLTGFLSDMFDLPFSLTLIGSCFGIAGLMYFIVFLTYNRDFANMKQVTVEF